MAAQGQRDLAGLVAQRRRDRVAAHHGAAVHLPEALRVELRQQLAQRSRSLEDAEARYDAVFNSALSLMSVCTTDGTILDEQLADAVGVAKIQVEQGALITVVFPAELTDAANLPSSLALVTEPACVLADEPTGNLDRENAARVFELILQLNRRHDAALVMVTHDPDLAARMGRTLHIADGRLA